MNSENEQLVVSRDNVTNKLKRWVQLDTQLKLINEKTKTMRDERARLSGEICIDMETAGISKRKIILPDGDIKIYEKKDYSQLTFGFLEQHLGKIMNDPQQVSFVINYLKEQREVKSSNDLKRTYSR